MLGLVVAFALADSAPPDFALPVQSSMPVKDRLINNFPAATQRRLRGILISDDGTTAFGVDNGIEYCELKYGTPSVMQVFRRNWLPSAPLISSNQAGWLESSTGFDKKKQTMTQVNDFEILAAQDHEHVTISAPYKPEGDGYFELAISNLSLEYGEPKETTLTYTPKDSEFATSMVPDASSPAYFANICKRNAANYDVIDQRPILGSIPGHADIKPGYGAFLFDSASDAIVCFTYTEQGSPFGLAVKHLKSDATERVTLGPPGRVGNCVLLPGGRILASCGPINEAEPREAKYGLYECNPTYKTSKFVGPYLIQGSSRNGKWLLISHRELRKSWLVNLAGN